MGRLAPEPEIPVGSIAWSMRGGAGKPQIYWKTIEGWQYFEMARSGHGMWACGWYLATIDDARFWSTKHGLGWTIIGPDGKEIIR